MADSKYTAGVEAIQRISIALRGMNELAEVLTRAGSMEQAAAEAEARMQAAQRDEGLAVEARQQAEQDLKGLEEAIMDKSMAADAEARRVVSDAHEQAKTIVAAAEDAASRLTADAMAAAQAAVDASNRAVDTLAQNRDALQADVDRLTAERDLALKQTIEAQTQLDAVRAAAASIIKGV
jgi:hypothetical protein